MNPSELAPGHTPLLLVDPYNDVINAASYAHQLVATAHLLEQFAALAGGASPSHH